MQHRIPKLDDDAVVAFSGVFFIIIDDLIGVEYAHYFVFISPRFYHGFW